MSASCSSGDDREALLTRAEERLQARDIEEAASLFLSALDAGADPERTSAGLWMAHMFAGDFAAAHRVSDAIRRRGAPDPHRFWNGESITGKRVIVRCLHGFGDAVQMLRFLPLLKAQCTHVTVEVAPRLVALTKCLRGEAEVITWGEDAPTEAPEWDVQIEVMELPYVFRTMETDLPVAWNYLAVPHDEQRLVGDCMGASPFPRVGLVWSASEWDPTRCIPGECIDRILRTNGVEFWNLQGGQKHAMTRHTSRFQKTRDAAELGDGPLRLAAIVMQLDLVITVDTLAAHLAGALGRPAWVLLQHAADWRWMDARAGSPWYPSLRLLRQSQQGDWAGLTAGVCEELERWKLR